MPWRRLVRTVLVYALLGAIATVLSSWAIHAVQFRIASTFGRLSLPRTPTVFWPVPHQDARQLGLDPAAATALGAIDTGHWNWMLIESHYEHLFAPRAMAREINADRLWRRHRSASDRLPTLPDYPYPFWLARTTPARSAWVPMIAQAKISGGDTLAARHWSLERLCVVRTGWPLAAMEIGWHEADEFEDRSYTIGATTHVSSHRYAGQLARPRRVSVSGGIELWRGLPLANPSQNAYRHPPDPLDRFALPLRPLWPGFLINTFFYAILAFALVRTPRVVRRAIRRRRGRCVGCGYDRDGLDPEAACPECGVGVRLRRAIA